MIHDGLRHVFALQNGLLRRAEAALDDQRHARNGGGTGVRNGVGRIRQVFQLLVRRHIAAFVRRQRHAHGRRGVGTRALRHHVGNGLRHFLMRLADHEFHLAGVDAAIQNANLAGVVPRHVFILKHKSQTLICSLHLTYLPLRTAASRQPLRFR